MGILGCARTPFLLLLAREALYLLYVLACAWVNPAFLLVDVGASVRDDIRGGMTETHHGLIVHGTLAEPWRDPADLQRKAAAPGTQA